MGSFAGAKGLVLGVANDHSIAWAIAKMDENDALNQTIRNIFTNRISR